MKLQSLPLSVASIADEERYRLLIDAVTDYAIFMLNPEGYITSWNTGAQRLKGYEPSEIIGEHFSRFYSPEDQEKGLPARALRIAAQEGRFESEGWRIRKDGTQFWANVLVDPVRTPSGELIGFAKITRDLTERKLAEENLRESQEQLRLLIEGVTDYAIYMLNPAGFISSWNTGAERIKGYSAEEVIGQHFSIFYPERDRRAGEPQKTLETATRENRFEKEAIRIRKDGREFWAHVIVDAIRSSSGELLGFAKITRDITERRETQKALEQTRERLFQSQKMEAVGQLTGGVAHDFNNLLMVILGSLELVRKRVPDDPRITRLLDNAIQGAQRGASLTQRMLTFARRQDIRLGRVELPRLIESMKDLLQSSLGPAITLDLRFPPKLPPVTCDANQLELAVLNICLNARDAMPKGGPIIIQATALTLTTANSLNLPPGKFVCLAITDTGLGMDSATLARASEPFFTTKGVGHGTGLGLSVVHGLAEQCGGRLRLKSQLSKGTTAEIWLPVGENPAESQEEPASEKNASQLVILAVDDDALVLMNTEAMIEDLGHRPITSSSAREALEVLRSQDVDLVITDQAMPRMTGAELAEAIQAEWPHLPIVVATGYAELPDAPKGLRILNKPFTQGQLDQTISEAIKTSQ